MSVSMEPSVFTLPDFASAEFSLIDLPSRETRVETVPSGVSFTSWRKQNTHSEEDKTQGLSSTVEVHCLPESSLEACDSAYLQGRFKGNQLQHLSGKINTMELTFPTCGNPSSPRLQSEQNQEVEDKELSKDCSLTSSQRMSNKSLYRSVGFGNTQAITDGWVKVEFWIVEDQKVEIEFAVVEEKSRPFFAMEKEREDQFFNRNEHALHEINKKLKNNNDRISESDSEDEFDDIPLYNDDDDVEEKRSAGSSRRPHGWESKASKFLKSVSMTTLVLSGNLEPTNAGVENDVVGQAESYEVPYIDGAKGYGAAEMPSPADFGFCSAQHYAENYPWSASTPKLRRNLNKKIKTKWQPVSRFVSRCYQWDSCSSVDSSSRWFSFSPRRIIKRAICCGSTVSSDDETGR